MRIIHGTNYLTAKECELDLEIQDLIKNTMRRLTNKLAWTIYDLHFLQFFIP
jgi:hypothetical protein